MKFRFKAGLVSTSGTSLLPFSPTYDADGNMTTVQTSTGTWNVSYDAHNRPVTWTKSSGEKIHMMYDSQGRRVEKRVLNAAGTRTLRERYIYVGYTCVQVLNGDDGNAVVKEFAWDPTEPVATRPLMFKYVPNGVTLFCAFDGNKNVSDVFSWAVRNGVPAHYDYAPFGAITRAAKDTPFTLDLLSLNPWRFSSEFYDSELDLIYYNYRHYSPLLGRFLSRDPIAGFGGLNLYAFCGNKVSFRADILGLEDASSECECPTGEEIFSIDIVYPDENQNPIEAMLAELANSFFQDKAFPDADERYFKGMDDFLKIPGGESVLFKIGIGGTYGGFSGGGNIQWTSGQGWGAGFGPGPVPGGNNGETGMFVNVGISVRF